MKANNKEIVKRFSLVLIFIFFLYYTFLLFTSSIGYNVETQKYLITNLVNKISPQGWGFFTRSPREDNVDVFLLGKELNKIEFMPQNSDLSNAWGMDKKSRMKGFETSMILEKLQGKKWSDTELKKPEFILIPSKDLHYFKKGNKYIFVKYMIVPYLWQKYVTTPPKQYIYIQMQ